MFIGIGANLSAGGGGSLWAGSAVIDMDFANDRYLLGGRAYYGDEIYTAPGLSISTPAGYVETAAGLLVPTTAGKFRRSDKGLLVEEARTNSLRNSTATNGATVGVIGSGGALPTNWGVSTISGIAYEVIGTGTSVIGLPYVDVRISGTNSTGSTAFPAVNFETTTGVTAANGQSWTGSFWAARVGGSATGFLAFNSNIVETTAAGAYVANGTTAISLTTTIARVGGTRTLAGGGTVARAYSGLSASIPNGNSVDITIRFVAPQFEQGALATSYTPTTSVAVTRSADVDYLGGLSLGAEFTVLADFIINALVPTAQVPRVLAYDDGTIANTADVFANDLGQVRQYARSGGVTTVDGGTRTFSVGSITRAAARFKVNDFALSVNAQAAQTDSLGAMPVSPTTLWLGSRSTGSYLNGYIRRIRIFSAAMNDAELAALTA